MGELENWIGPLLIVGGFVISYIIVTKQSAKAKSEREEFLSEARSDAERIRSESRTESQDWAQQQREDVQREVREGRKEIKQSERDLRKREDSLDRRMDLLSKKEQNLESLEGDLDQRKSRISTKENEIEDLVDQQRENLERAANMSRDEARTTLLDSMKQEVDHEGDQLIQRMVERVKDSADTKCKSILASTLQRISATYCQESTVTSVEIASDDMKGRIIGREGRNIRAFEKATGVDVIVDDSPGVITLSCFDPIRREMGSRALSKLLQDGRIHPSRIEEIVGETKKSLNEEIQKSRTTIYNCNV